MAVDITTARTSVTEIYIAAFNRVPDTAGLAYWVDLYMNKGVALNTIAEGFTTTAEYKATYPSVLTNTEYVDKIYLNVFGRPADSGGEAYWVGLLNNNTLNWGNIMQEMLKAAHANGSSDGTRLTNLSNFGVSCAINNIDAALATTYLQSITADPATVTAAQNAVNTSSLTYTLTTGVDNKVANIFYSSLTPYNTDGKGPTLQYTDTLTGVSTRTDNILYINDDYNAGTDVIPLGATLSGIQNIVLQTNGNAGGTATFDTTTSRITGVTSVNINSAGNGNDLVQVGSGTKLVVYHHNVTNGDTTTLGGSDVTVTSNSPTGTVMVGNGTAGSTPTAALLPTGAVNVTQNGTGPAPVRVMGGTTVNVTSTSSSHSGIIQIGNTAGNTGNTAAGASSNASGAITVTAAGTGAITVYGGSSVTIADNALVGAGAITVGDNGALASVNNTTGNITITETNQKAYDGKTTGNNVVSGAITAYGGKDVTVTTNGGGTVTVGAATVASAKPTGNVTVTTTGISNTTARGFIDISGGVDVTVTAAGGGVRIGQQNNAAGTTADNPTGAVKVTETSTRGVDPTVAMDNTITIDGGTTVDVTAKGQVVSIGAKAAPTGAITVSQSDILTGRGYAASKNAASTVTANGGTTVTVNTTGGSVTVGAQNPNILPTGAVTITDTYGGAGNDAIAVMGGTTVGITTTYTDGAITAGHANAILLDPTGVSLKSAVLAPTGNVTISNVTAGNSINGAGTATNYYGAGATNVYTNGGDTVSITGGAVANVIDIQSTLATGGSGAGKAVGTSKLATVTLNGVQTGGAVAVKSDALANLSILNNRVAGNTYTVTNNTSAHALTITQGGNDNTYAADGQTVVVNAGSTVTDAMAGSVTVTDNGTGSSATMTVTAAKATGLTVNNAGTANLAIGGSTALTSITVKGAGATTLSGSEALTKLATIDASGSTGSFTFSGSAAGNGWSPTTTAGVTQKFIGSTGVNTLTLATNASGWGDSVSVTGGSGTSDVLVANYAAGATDVAMGNTASVKGFEILGLGANATSAAANYDATGFTGVTMGAVAAGVTITNAAKGASLSITAAPGFNTTFTGSATATAGTADALTINVGTTTSAGGLNAGTVTANSYEAITINSNSAAATSTTANLLTLTDKPTAAASPSLSLTVGGTGAITLTDSTTRFTSMTSTNTKTVDLDAVTASNKGVAITGGAGVLKATGATGGTEVVSAALTGTAFAINDTWVMKINNETFTYTATAADTITTAAAHMAAALTAWATTGPVEKAGAVAAPTALSATASGGNLLLTTTDTAQAYSTLGGVNTGTVTAVTNALVGGSEEQLITITQTATAAANSTSVATINGNAATYTATGGETAAQTATGLAAAINALAAANKIGVTSAVASGANVVITGGGNGVFLSTSGAIVSGVITTTKSAIAINYATANDSFTSGAGGGTYTAGLGGKWSNTTHRYSSGSETVNLAASTAVVDTLKLADGRVVTNNGTLGGVTSFVTGSLAASDIINLTSAAKTVVANSNIAAAVSAVNGAATMANCLDPSGALLTALANLTYTISNGVITFSATGGHSLTEFTTAQLISAAEILVNSSTTGGANKAAVFSTGGNSYVVVSDAGNTLNAGTDALDTLVQLTGVSSATGFGTKIGNLYLGGQGAVVAEGLTNTTAAAANSGSATAAVYDETGFSADTIVNAEFGTVSTTIKNLAPSAVLTLSGTGGATYEAVTVSQTGTSGANGLALKMDTGAATYKSITVNGDGLLILDSAGGAHTINSLIDGGSTNTLTTIQVDSGNQALTVKSITDTALTTVSSIHAGAAVTFGDAASPITNNGVAFSFASGFNTTITASGNNDTFTSDASKPAGGAGVITITASGAANTFTLTSTAAGNTITANGAGNTFNIGNTAGTGGYTITATGTGNTVTFTGTHNTATTVDTGANAVITFGAGNEQVWVGGDATGGSSSSYAFTTLKNVTNGVTKSLDYTVAGIADGDTAALGGVGAAGQTLANAQVNVSSATTLAAALDMAANITGLTYTPGTDAGTAVFGGGYVYGNGGIKAAGAVIDWFQYGGDTYIVESVNNSAAFAAHTALGSSDVVIKICGLVDLSAATYNNTTGVLTFI